MKKILLLSLICLSTQASATQFVCEPRCPLETGGLRLEPDYLNIELSAPEVKTYESATLELLQTPLMQLKDLKSYSTFTYHGVQTTDQTALLQ